MEQENKNADTVQTERDAKDAKLTSSEKDAKLTSSEDEEQEKSIFDEPAVAETPKMPKNELTPDLPEQFNDITSMDYVKSFMEFNPQVQKEQVDIALRAYNKFFSSLDDTEKAKELEATQDENIAKATRLRNLLKKGEQYFKTSQWGRVQQAGGLQQYADQTENVIKSLYSRIQKLEGLLDVDEDLPKKNKELQDRLAKAEEELKQIYANPSKALAQEQYKKKSNDTFSFQGSVHDAIQKQLNKHVGS